MDFDGLLVKYRALLQEERGERDEGTYQAIVEVLEQDTPLDALYAWAASQHMYVDKDTWKVYHRFLDDLCEVERVEAARASEGLVNEANWGYLEGTDAAWHV